MNHSKKPKSNKARLETKWSLVPTPTPQQKWKDNFVQTQPGQWRRGIRSLYCFPYKLCILYLTSCNQTVFFLRSILAKASGIRARSDNEEEEKQCITRYMFTSIQAAFPWS